MPNLQDSNRETQRSRANDLFVRAFKDWDRGKLQSAFRLFMAAAKAGDKGAQVNVGYFYDVGIGVRRNRSAALGWYKRAYRRGDASAATNIGTIWRDEKKPKQALAWFQRAVNLGDDSANLEIAKYYLAHEGDPSRAIGFLNKVCQSDRVAEVELEEAKRLLKKAQQQLKRKRSDPK